MALMGCNEQLEAEAVRVNGVFTSDPLDGLLTVTAASALAAKNTSDEARVSFRVLFIKLLHVPSDRLAAVDKGLLLDGKVH
jgi:hypothetical protein